MFWVIVEPFEIACMTIGGIIVTATVFAPLVGWRRSRTFLWTTLIGIALLIPSCQAVMTVIDKTRFGGFAYVDYESVDNERVSQWLPPTAKDITVYCRANGHDARFRVQRDELVAWFSDYRARFGWQEPDDPLVLAEPTRRRYGEEYFNLRFGKYGWECPPEYVEFGCTVAGNYKGFTILYSESQETAFLWCGYW